MGRSKKCIEEYCQKHGIKYQIITENEIWNERYNNVEFFRKNKRKPTLLTQIKPEIIKGLNKNPGTTRIDLSIRVSEKLKLDVKQVIPVIDHLIYSDFFLLDFEEKIDENTELYLRLKKNSKIIPLY